MSKTLKVSVEWNNKTYTKEETIESTPTTVNPGDKTLPLMGEALERLMMNILWEIVKQG
jgi:hypothetical protein